MANASIVFGVCALLLLSAVIGLGIVALGYVALAVAIIGAILGAVSRATMQGKAGLILSLASLLITVLGIAFFRPAGLVITGDQAVETAPTN